jgi:hypothetical protein
MYHLCESCAFFGVLGIIVPHFGAERRHCLEIRRSVTLPGIYPKVARIPVPIRRSLSYVANRARSTAFFDARATCLFGIL